MWSLNRCCLLPTDIRLLRTQILTSNAILTKQCLTFKKQIISPGRQAVIEKQHAGTLAIEE